MLRVGRTSTSSLLVTLVAALLLATAAAAETTIAFDVMVVHVTEAEGRIDPRAEKYDKLLGKQLRYGGLKVLESSRRKVALDQIEVVKLPAGGPFRFRPLDVSEGGVLVAVEAEKMAQGDFRLPKGKPLLLGGRSYQGGKLAVILESHY